MNIRTFTIPTLLVTMATALPAQKPADASQWRVMLEKAVFARAYEGDPDNTQKLFEQALAAAKASGEDGAADEVERQRQSGTTQQDPRSEIVIGRMLESIAMASLPERQKAIFKVDWDFYQRDPSTVPCITKCFAGKVVVGDVVVDLRVEDILQIANQLDARYNTPILRAALEHDNPFVRTMALDHCRRDSHLMLIIKALTDENQLVREAACERVPSPEDLSLTNRQTLTAAIMRALDLGTVGAVEHAINLPGFLGRMQKASHDSVLAQAIMDARAEPDIEAWDANLTAMTKQVLDWAEQATDKKRTTKLITCAYNWLCAERHTDAYPTELARRCVAMALGNIDSFRTGMNDEHIGDIIASIGSMEDLVTLGARWIVDPAYEDECSSLFSMVKRLGKEHTDALIKNGVTLANYVTKEDHTRAAFRHYWSRLGSHSWYYAGSDKLQAALAAIAALADDHRGLAYPAFVIGVRKSMRANDQIKVMEPHYANVTSKRLVAESQRIQIANDLVAAGSKYAVEAALALRGRWNVYRQQEQYGDFLRRACSKAGDAGKVAVLAAIRGGYTTPPPVLAGQQLTQTSWPMQVGGGRGSKNGWIPTPPPADKIVFKKESKFVRLPSLLCVLPPQQAAEAAKELWSDEKSPLPRAELVRVLLFARSSKLALDTLVAGFADIDDIGAKAEVLRVFGELLHPAGRKLIAVSLDSEEPVIRHAALEAAQNVLAHVRARQGMRVYRDQ